VSAQLEKQPWLAQFSADLVSVDEHTRLGHTMHYGPLRVQRPFYPEGKDLIHLYLLHPPGGLVGGDELNIKLHLGPNSHGLLTTPSAGKIYRNITTLNQGQNVNLTVCDGASLEWLPMENIIFNGAKAELNTSIDIHGSGIYMGWEITCLGRTECNEMFSDGAIKQTLVLNKDGKVLFKDRLNLIAGSELQTNKAGFQGFSVLGSFIVSSEPDFDYGLWQQEMNEKITPCFIAITQRKGVLIARVLTHKSEMARMVFEALWAKIRPLVIKREACAPRIWNT